VLFQVDPEPQVNATKPSHFVSKGVQSGLGILESGDPESGILAGDPESGDPEFGDAASMGAASVAGGWEPAFGIGIGVFWVAPSTSDEPAS